MLESVIALPIIMLVLFGSLEFGLVFSRYQILLGVTAQAAREASLFRTNCEPPVVIAEINTALQASGKTIGMDLTDGSKTTILITNLCLPGRFVTVDITYRHSMQFLGGFPGQSLVMPLRARVRMRNDT